MSKFNELYKCPRCGIGAESLFSSGLVREPCCTNCYSSASAQAIDRACNPVGDIKKRGVTTKTVAAAIKEILK